ncbi:hypothetical protein ISCGN_010064 [Ixodes scapularis]
MNFFFEKYYHSFHSRAVGHSGGSGILIRKDRGFVIYPEWETDRNGRVCSVEVIRYQESVKIISVHAPCDAADRKAFFTNLRKYLDSPVKTIIAGDFNCVLNTQDCSRNLQSDSSRSELDKLLRDFDLVDAIEASQGSRPSYTHWQGCCHARLDRVYMSSELIRAVTAYQVSPVAFSDHAMVALRVGKVNKTTRKPFCWSSWKLNESLLDDEALCSQIKNTISEATQKGDVDAVAWEEIKEKIKLLCYDHSKEKAKKARETKNALLQALQTLIAEENKTPGVFTDDIRACKAQLLGLMESEYRGAMVRSRLRALEKEEDPCKIFKTKERMRAQHNRIDSLQVGDQVLTEQKDIEEELVREFRELFTSKDEGINRALDEWVNALPKIPISIQKRMNKTITKSEIAKAIKELPPRKSPGVDGLGSAFYKKFADVLVPVLYYAFADILRRDLLPPSMRQALTVLIPKKSTGSSVLTSDRLRPISLLTTDYKLLARILAKRLEMGLKFVVGDHQTYGFKGRSITSNVHTLRILSETAETTGLSAAVLQIDLSKAFDRVSHAFLFNMLEACGVGKRIAKYIKLCYKDISTRLLVNGSVTEKISVQGSVRQGCPLSPILFSLYLEPVCRRIISDTRIQGVPLARNATKMLAYADDVTVVAATRLEIVLAVQHFADFCEVSGAQMNHAKSTGAWLGDWDVKPQRFINIDWSSTLTNYLGVSLDPYSLRSGKGGIHLNSLRAKVQDWRGRNLSILNRAFVCNSVFFSTVWYAAQLVPCHASEIHKMHRFCATFIWNSSFERMRRTNIFVNQAKGGFGVANLEIKLKVQRFLFFRDQRNSVIVQSFVKLGGRLLAPWLVVTQEGATSAAILRFYKEIAAAIKFFEARFSRQYLSKVKRKTLYWDTVDTVFPPPLYRSFLGTDVESTVFKRLRSYPVRKAAIDFFISFHTEVLPVKTWQEKKGFFVPWNLNCVLCPTPETLQHVFLFCPNAELFWAELRCRLQVELYMDWRSAKLLEFGTGPDSKCLEVLALLGLHAIWKSRTDHLLVLEEGKPAWRHFEEGFMIASSLIAEVGNPEMAGWAELEARFKMPKTPRNRRR